MEKLPDHGSTRAKIAVDEKRQVKLDFLGFPLPHILLRETHTENGKEDHKGTGNIVEADRAVAVGSAFRILHSCSQSGKRSRFASSNVPRGMLFAAT